MIGSMEKHLEAYEDTWNRGTTPDVSDFLKTLPCETEIDAPFVEELIKIAIHRHWETSARTRSLPEAQRVTSVMGEAGVRRGRVEHYRDLLVEYGIPDDYPDSILTEELIARIAAGDEPSFPELRSRFPDMARERLQSCFTQAAIYGRDHGMDDSVRSALPPELAGTRFQVRHELGQGGMGRVFLAYDPRLDREVAVKIPHRHLLARPEMRARFRREGQAAAAIKHPNVVAAYEIDVADDRCVLVTEYVDGVSLEAWMNDRAEAIPIRTAARLIELIARAAQAAHDAGVVHRDLKPANILFERHEVVSRDASAPPHGIVVGKEHICPKISDFGLAGIECLESSLTKTGLAMGTAAYMAPEQVQGERSDHPVDVFSLGVIAYQLLTGVSPFLRPTYADTIDRVLHYEPPSVRHYRPSIPRDLATICERSIEKSPASRYSSAGALADDLQRFLKGQPVLARPVGPVERVWRWSRRRPGLATLAVVLMALMVWSLVQNARLQTALDDAHGKKRIAEEATSLANKSLRSAEARTRELNQEIYAREMRQAFAALDKGWVRDADDLLVDQIPGPGATDFRGFEWELLRHMLVQAEPVELHTSQDLTHAVAAFDDGRRLASVGADGAIRIWDVEKRAVEFCIEAPGARIPGSRSLAGFLNRPDFLHLDAVAVSPDGTKLATGGLVLTLWDLPTRKPLRNLAAYKTPINHIAFSADGKRLVAKNASDMLRVFSTDSGECLLESRIGAVEAPACFSRDGKRLISWKESDVGRDRHFRLAVWDTETWEPAVFGQSWRTLTACVLDATGRYLFSGNSANISVYDTLDRELVGRFDYRAGVTDLALTGDNRKLAASFSDGTIACWDLPELTETVDGGIRGIFDKPPVQIAVHRGAILAIEFMDHERIVSCGRDRSLRISRLIGSRYAQRHVLSRCDRVWGGRGKGDSELILVNAVNAKAPTIRSVDMATFATNWERKLPVADAWDHPVSCLAVSPDGNRAAIGVCPCRVLIFDLQRGQLLHEIDQYDKRKSHIGDMDFSPNGKWLAVGCADQTVRVYQTDSWEPVFREDTRGWPGNVEFSHDSRRLAFSANRQLIVLATGTWREQSRNRINSELVARSLRFLGDDQQIACAHEDTFLRVWNVKGLTLDHDLRGNGGAPALRVHPNLKVLATHSPDAVKIWHLSTMSHIATLKGFERAEELVFSRDGTMFCVVDAIGNKQVAIHVWNTNAPQPALNLPPPDVPIHSEVVAKD